MMGTTERAPLGMGWILTACGVVVLLLIATGCCALTDADHASLQGQLDAWRKVRTEGRSWSDDVWDKRLAAYAAECRVLGAKLGDTLKPGDTIRWFREERTRAGE